MRKNKRRKEVEVVETLLKRPFLLVYGLMDMELGAHSCSCKRRVSTRNDAPFYEILDARGKH